MRKKSIREILESPDFYKRMTFEEFVAGVNAGTIPSFWGGDDVDPGSTARTIRTLKPTDEISYLVDAASERGAIPDDEPFEEAKARLLAALKSEPEKPKHAGKAGRARLKPRTP